MRFLVLKAFWNLVAFDLRRLGSNFGRLHATMRSLKVADREPPRQITDLICDAVNRACAWYPKRVLCLQRSVVITHLLRNCGVRAQMVLGAKKLPFKAHAWVEVNGQPVNERSTVQEIYGVWERC